MSLRFQTGDGANRPELVSLMTDIEIRLLNISGAGCLVETKRPLEIGSVGTLRIQFAGGDFEDTVQIVRCQLITGAGGVFHLGANFLTTSAPSIESLRYLIRRETRRPVGYIRPASGNSEGPPAKR